MERGYLAMSVGKATDNPGGTGPGDALATWIGDEVLNEAELSAGDSKGSRPWHRGLTFLKKFLAFTGL